MLLRLNSGKKNNDDAHTYSIHNLIISFSIKGYSETFFKVGVSAGPCHILVFTADIV